jgi:hypothetical protein
MRQPRAMLRCFKQAGISQLSENNRGGSQNCRAAFSGAIGHKRPIGLSSPDDAEPSSDSPQPGTQNRGAAKASAGQPKGLLATARVHSCMGKGAPCLPPPVSAVRHVPV